MAVATAERVARKLAAPRGTEILEIPLDICIVEEGYQRKLNVSRVNRYADAWDDAKCGAITGTMSRGSFYVLDGQHRCYAAKRAGRTHILAVSYPTVGLQRQAHLFAAINRNRTALNSGELHRADLAAGEPEAVAIDASLRTAGYDPKDFKAFSALAKARATHGANFLNALLQVTARAWPEDTRVSHVVVNGSVALYAAFPDLDWDRFQKALSAKTQYKLVATANSRQSGTSWRLTTLMALTLGEQYNGTIKAGPRSSTRLKLPSNPREFGKAVRSLSTTKTNKERKGKSKLNGARKKPAMRLVRPGADTTWSTN